MLRLLQDEPLLRQARNLQPSQRGRPFHARGSAGKGKMCFRPSVKGGGGLQGMQTKQEVHHGQNRAANEHPKASALRIRLLTNMALLVSVRVQQQRRASAAEIFVCKTRRLGRARPSRLRLHNAVTCARIHTDEFSTANVTIKSPRL